MLSQNIKTTSMRVCLGEPNLDGDSALVLVVRLKPCCSQTECKLMSNMATHWNRDRRDFHIDLL